MLLDKPHTAAEAPSAAAGGQQPGGMPFWHETGLEPQEQGDSWQWSALIVLAGWLIQWVED